VRAIDINAEHDILALLLGPVLWKKGTAYYTLGKGNRKPLPFIVAAKTGTTNNFRDAWITGFTYGPEGYTVLVWLGMEDNTPLGDDIHREPGGRAAAPIAKEILENIYKKGSPEPFPGYARLVIEYAITATEKLSLIRQSEREPNTTSLKSR